MPGYLKRLNWGNAEATEKPSLFGWVTILRIQIQTKEVLGILTNLIPGNFRCFWPRTRQPALLQQHLPSGKLRGEGTGGKGLAAQGQFGRRNPGPVTCKGQSRPRVLAERFHPEHPRAMNYQNQHDAHQFMLLGSGKEFNSKTIAIPSSAWAKPLATDCFNKAHSDNPCWYINSYVCAIYLKKRSFL